MDYCTITGHEAACSHNATPFTFTLNTTSIVRKSSKPKIPFQLLRYLSLDFKLLRSKGHTGSPSSDPKLAYGKFTEK